MYFINYPVKILILTSYYPPLGASGQDARCQNVAKALSAKRHRLQVLTSNYRLPPMGIQSDDGIYRELTLHGDHTDEELAAFSYKRAFALDLNNVTVLDERLSRFNPDLVLVWDTALLSKSLLKRLDQADVPVAYDLHSDYLFDESFARDPWQWWWQAQQSLGARFRRLCMTLTGARRRVLRKLPIYDPKNLDFSRAYIVSDSLKQSFVDEGFDTLVETPVIRAALGLQQFLTKTEYKSTGRFMWAGRLSTGKAPDLVLAAVGLLKHAGVPVEVDIYGMGGPLERKAMRLSIYAAGLAECVKMVGIRPGEIIGHYSSYDALLFTSRCSDPFPMTPLEAMLSGLPCILARDGGIQEVVTDGKTALLFERDNAEALAQAIRRFIAIPDSGRDIATKCKESLQATNSLDAYINRIEECLLPKASS